MAYVKLNTNWGRSVTVKFYLNTKVKPISIGEEKKLYPLYVTIICKKQVLQFKYFEKNLQPEFYSEKAFNEIFGSINLNKPETFAKKGAGFSIYYHFQKQVEFLIDLFDAFERDNFKIRNFVDVIRNYYALEHVANRIMTSFLVKEMLKQGYSSLVPIIDWKNQHPKGIESCLLEFQEKLKLKKTRIDFESLPFYHIQEILEIVKNLWKSRSKENVVDLVIAQLDPKSVKEFEDMTKKAVSEAVEFYKKGIQMTR